MTGNSSYLDHLPPVLWRDRADQSPVPLGSALKVFEKLLTGIDDDATLEHQGHEHPALSDHVTALPELFDPWATPTAPDRDFLGWLASWLALSFPSLEGTPLWDEYQQRNATSKIAAIYRQRGLKVGLDRFLDLYAAGSLRPRVSVDDGARLLTVTPDGPAHATVCALVSQGPVLSWDRTVLAEGLIRPQCVAVAPDGSVFAADAPLQGIPLPLKSRVWRFTPTGEYRTATASPDAPAAGLTFTEPRRYPLAPASLNPVETRAITVAPPQSGRPETVYVLEPSGRVTAVPAPYERTGLAPVAPATLLGSVAAAGVPLVPVAMTVDPVSGDLLVLDKGSGLGTPNPPKILTVSVSPLAVTRMPLTTVVEPLALMVDPDGTLLVGDGGEQEPTDPAQLPGNVVRVDRSTTPWTEVRLLPDDNPLRAPAGIARTDDGSVYVLDAGLKPFARPSTDPFIRAVAEPASIYLLQQDGAQGRLVRLTMPGSFVLPVGMASTGSRLVVCDRGETDPQNPSWARLNPFEFDVVIHWSEPRLPTDPNARRRLLGRVVGDLRAVIDEQKPAHAVWNLVTRY